MVVNVSHCLHEVYLNRNLCLVAESKLERKAVSFTGAPVCKTSVKSHVSDVHLFLRGKVKYVDMPVKINTSVKTSFFTMDLSKSHYIC